MPWPPVIMFSTDTSFFFFTKKKKKQLTVVGCAPAVGTHPKPGVSQVDSLRLRSEHSGSNELSPTPLIFSAYQHLRAHRSCMHARVSRGCDIKEKKKGKGDWGLLIG